MGGGIEVNSVKTKTEIRKTWYLRHVGTWGYLVWLRFPAWGDGSVEAILQDGVTGGALLLSWQHRKAPSPLALIHFTLWEVLQSYHVMGSVDALDYFFTDIFIFPASKWCDPMLCLYGQSLLRKSTANGFWNAFQAICSTGWGKNLPTPAQLWLLGHTHVCCL